MKKLFIIALLCVFGSFSVIHAQVKDNAIKVNLFGAIVNQYLLSYERAFGEKLTGQLSLGYIDRTWEITSSLYEGSYQIGPRGFIVIPEVRYYFSEGIKGAYAGAFFRYRNVNQMVIDGVDDSYTMSDGTEVADLDWSYHRNKTSIGGGLVLGYQILISEAAVIDIFIGPQYKALSIGSIVYDSSDVTEDDVTILVEDKGESDGIGVRFGVNFGIAF